MKQDDDGLELWIAAVIIGLIGIIALVMIGLADHHSVPPDPTRGTYNCALREPPDC